MIQRLLISCVFFLHPVSLFSGAQLLEIARDGQIVQRKWRTPKIRWRYNPTNAPTGAREIIQQAFDSWATQSLSAISNEYAGTTNITAPAYDGYSDIFFNVSMGSVGADDGQIAVSILNSSKSLPSNSNDATLLEADILINPSVVSSLITTAATDPSDLDLIEILNHEIGHAYGLGHSFLIDSVMYPAKPSPSDSQSLKDLFRISKRSLSQDDIAWMGSLYPSSRFGELTSQIAGQVTMNRRAYTGAHVIALKTDESDLDFEPFNTTHSENIVIKGLQNVSSFSDKDGNFLIKGLKPGSYKILVQNASGFMEFTLARVNSYLERNASNEVFPLQFWSNPDCANASVVTSSNILDLYQSTQAFSISANQGYCGMEIVSHSGGTTCGNQASYQTSCEDDGGGCTLTAERKNSPLYFTFFILFAIGLVGIRRSHSQPRVRSA